MIYFTSDLHFNHKNIIRKLSSWGPGSTMRDFDSILQMNQTIIDNINKKVGSDDTLICLGDWTFGSPTNMVSTRNQINCKNIELILGNHDGQHGKEFDPYVGTNFRASSLFSFYGRYMEFSHKQGDDSYYFVCFHYPITSWNHMGSGAIHLHGHCHSPRNNRFFNGGKSMDVGLDGNNMEVYSMDDIIKIMKERPIKREGHH